MERNDFDKWLFEVLQKKLKRQPSEAEFEKFSNKMTAAFEKLRTALDPWVKDIKKYTTKIERDAKHINDNFGFKPDAKHFSEIVMNEFSADDIDAMMFSDPAPHIRKYIEIYRKQLERDYHNDTLKNRHKAAIFYFKVLGKYEERPKRADYERREGKNIATEFFSLEQPKSKNHKPLKKEEIELILPHLKDFPKAEMKALEQLSKLE